MNDHIFDILGIGSREDSYTDLIAYAFKHLPKFRENFLMLLGEKVNCDWECLIRPPVSIRKSIRTKDIPDLILFSKKTGKALLIENKIFSGEGWEQTKRYASDEFRNSLVDHLDTNSLNLKYFFLTLEGEKAASTKFKLITYYDVSACIPKSIGSSKLVILLQELQERIDEYYKWPLPNDDTVVLEYLKKNTKRLVNTYKTFRLITKKLLSEDFKKECGITANRGSGYIPLCLWYKESWRSKEYPKELNGSKCYDIHFELQWDTRKDWENLTLYLHYHTNPYFTQTYLKKLDRKFIAKYEENRNKLFNDLKTKKILDWTINKTPLRIAFYSFNRNVKFGEFKMMVNNLVSDVTYIVDKFIQKIQT